LNYYINRVGRITGGDVPGKYLKVVPIEGGESYYVFYSDDKKMNLKEAWDDWVEDGPSLKRYFDFLEEKHITIEWFAG
jgi:hypothetical protein